MNIRYGLIKLYGFLQIFNSHVYRDFLFILFLIIFSVIYNYQSILFMRPQSVHHWRQADCASIALNYYQTGMHFFSPQTHNLTSDNKTSGYNATSEIPIGYYFIAILYKIFGYHDFIYRFVNTAIFLLGLFFLYKTANLLFKDFFWASFIALFFFTSPVLVYYGNNFLTDSSAFAFALIGWYFFFRYYRQNRLNNFYFSMFFFLIAGAYKISALLSFTSICIVFMIEITDMIHFKVQENLFKNKLYNLLAFLVVIFVIAGWVFYAKLFNKIHSTGYFSTRIMPIWDMDHDEINQVIKSVKILWLKDYYHLFTLYFFACIFLFNLILIRKSDPFLAVNNLLLFGGSVLYVILWFETFNNHDYYTINLYILLVITLLNFIWLLKNRFSKFANSVIIKIIFFGFLFFNMIHAQKVMNVRYNGWWNEFPKYKDYHTITSYLSLVGIQPLDTVVCLPDRSHMTLYLMNQRGWTQCLNNNIDSTSIASSISKGAKYLIINGEEELKQNYLQSFITEPIGQYNEVYIYSLNTQ